MSASIVAPRRAPAPAPTSAGSGGPRSEGGGTAETSVVSFAVTGFEWVRGKGRLAGLADLRIEIEGVVLLLQGVRVLREPDGGLACQEPRFRHPDGRWMPVAVLPPELSEAIAATVLALARDADRSGR
jgi:stage V sporulation protein G